MNLKLNLVLILYEFYCRFYSIFPLLCLCKVLYQYSYYCYYHYYKLHINFTLSFIKKKLIATQQQFT